MYVSIKAMLGVIASRNCVSKYTMQIHGGTTSMSTVIDIPPPKLVRIKFFDFLIWGASNPLIRHFVTPSPFGRRTIPLSQRERMARAFWKNAEVG